MGHLAANDYELSNYGCLAFTRSWQRFPLSPQKSQSTSLVKSCEAAVQETGSLAHLTPLAQTKQTPLLTCLSERVITLKSDVCLVSLAEVSWKSCQKFCQDEIVGDLCGSPFLLAGLKDVWICQTPETSPL